MASDIEAFADVNFDWTRHLHSVWSDPPYHVEGLHKQAADEIIAYLLARTGERGIAPLGRVVVGSAGAGKTHLIGQLRRRAFQAKAWFVLIDVIGITDFWSTAVLGFLTSLQQAMPDGRTQIEAILGTILKGAAQDPLIGPAFRAWHAGPARTRRETIGFFVDLMRRKHFHEAFQHADVVRALLMLADEDWNAANVCYGWLLGLEVDPPERRALGLAGPSPDPAKIVQGLCWFMSLAGPTLIAVDQIDAIVTASNIAAGEARPADDTERKARAILEILASGLMDLHTVTQRAVTMVACLEPTWNILAEKTLKSFSGRFMPPLTLDAVSSFDLVENLVRARLAPAYSAKGFLPPYPTWPFTPAALESVVGLVPRQILMRCEDHRRLCAARGEVSICTSLQKPLPAAPVEIPARLDAIFRAEMDKAEVAGMLDRDTEDQLLPRVLGDLLGLYARQFHFPDPVDVRVEADPDLKRPSLHGRLAFSFRDEDDREEHYCFRAIAHPNAIAFQTRLRAAMTASGVDRNLPFRRLFIIRRDPPPSGALTTQMLKDLAARGGKLIAPSDADLRAWAALRAMRQAKIEGFEAWLQDRKPLCANGLFVESGLCPPPLGRKSEPETTPSQERPRHEKQNLGESSRTAKSTPARPAKAKPNGGASTPGGIPVGRKLERGLEGELLTLASARLRQHVAILAGSGSGKTVLLRRIVEEAALLGIPSVVLDLNNDLANLGEAWPQRPATFTDEDARKADRYRRTVEVVLWTPGRAKGNPLSLALLPDFAALEDPEERDEAVQMARATLLPFVGARGQAGQKKEGVLTQALRSFAARGGAGLDALIELLADLPEAVSDIGNAAKFAADMADQLRAAKVNHPLLEARGQSLDPQVLFGGTRGKTRVSVINFSGLPSDEAKQSFVNQLQMSLFSWIKRSPSRDGCLYVMDEAHFFAPSQKTVPSKESALSLVRQARKYGLGMIFATQALKDIDNRMISNCTTHFYGKMNSPAAIQAVATLLANKGGSGEEIARLATGEFFLATEDLRRPTKIRTQLCLSWHPASPPVAEEIVAKAHAAASIGLG
jgi:hypothetical protein